MIGEKQSTVTEDYITNLLSEEFNLPPCVFKSILKVGGKPQLVIFKRIAACREMNRMYSEGFGTEEICKILGEKYGYSRPHLITLPKNYRENFYEFNCCN